RALVERDPGAGGALGRARRAAPVARGARHGARQPLSLRRRPMVPAERAERRARLAGVPSRDRSPGSRPRPAIFHHAGAPRQRSRAGAGGGRGVRAPPVGAGAGDPGSARAQVRGGGAGRRRATRPPDGGEWCAHADARRARRRRVDRRQPALGRRRGEDPAAPGARARRALGGDPARGGLRRDGDPEAARGRHRGAIVIRVVESSFAAGRLDAARKFLAALPAGGEALVVGATRDAADDLVRDLTVELRASFGIHRASLPQLAARIAALELARLGAAHTTMLGAEALAARVAFEALGVGALEYFAPVA